MRCAVAAPGVAVAIALFAGGCGADENPESSVPVTTTTPELPTEAQVRAALMTADDLGPGWTSQSIPQESTPLCGVVTTANSSPVRGRSGFRKSPTGPFVAQRFIGFPEGGAPAVIAELRAAIDSCDTTTTQSGTTQVTWRVTPLAAPFVGDDVVGVRLTTDDSGTGRPAVAEEVIFRRGEFVGGVAHVSLGELDPALTERAAKAADRKLFMLAGG
jgi:hypothetical protein